jgi:hypothetical protein
MRTFAIAALVGTTAAWTTADPQLCSDTKCEVVKPHTCNYNELNYFGANHGPTQGYGEWAGKSLISTCDGTTQHSSMRIFHQNKESTCVNGHKCGIGLVTASAACECRPVCEFPDVYINGACRAHTYQFNAGDCSCANGSCDAGNTACSTCDDGFTLRRVNTDTTTSYKCVSIEGLKPSDQASAYKNCGADNKYSTDGTTCLTCPSGFYTAGGHDSTTRNACKTCPTGFTCDGTSKPALN